MNKRKLKLYNLKKFKGGNTYTTFKEFLEDFNSLNIDKINSKTIPVSYIESLVNHINDNIDIEIRHNYIDLLQSIASYDTQNEFSKIIYVDKKYLS